MSRENRMYTKDFMLSMESFSLVEMDSFKCLRTEPVPKNLNKYYQSDKYISHDEKPEGIISRTYSKVREFNLKLKFEWTGLKKGDSVLDVGCGLGDFLFECKKSDISIHGVELNEKARRISETKLNQKIYRDVYEESIKSKRFDVITLWHVLEHIVDPFELIEYLKTLLNPGGRILIAVPNYNSFDAKYYKGYWAAYDVPRHLWHFSRGTFDILKLKLGFSKLQTKGMIFDSFYISFISEKYKNAKIPVFGFFVGLLSNIWAFFTKEYSSVTYILRN